MKDTRFQITVIPVTPFQQNCLLIVDTMDMTGAIIDPGGDVPLIEETIRRAGARVTKIILTHGHIDHAGGARDLADRLECGIEGPHSDDQFLLDELPVVGLQYGVETAKAFKPDRYVQDGDLVTIGAMQFDVRHVPGHTPGHVIYVNEDAGFVIAGDTVFEGSVGRTDFPYGNTKQLMDAIREKILVLGDEIVLLPGHGNSTTVGAERHNNPFLKTRAA